MSLEKVPAPEGGEGWHPDPLGSRSERWFDGEVWTDQVRRGPEGSASPAVGPRRPASFMDRVREVPTWVKIVVPVVALAVAYGAIFGQGEGHGNRGSAPATGGGPKTASASPKTPEERQEAHIAAELRANRQFKESIAESVPDDESPEIDCFERQHCGVTYDIGEIVGIDTEEELLDDQRGVWAAMFADPRFRNGFVELEADGETIGGKQVTAPILRVRCGRGADRQIDWEKVRAEGFRRLCRWEELAEF